jgi:chemosensory pili system protein ChpA (sensor histidine kinase/response regulator)
MSQDKEREIQLQFLEEAQEYLDTIESVLLGLAGSHIDGHQMDAVLRAAHSVKGGAGMMGFQTLSQLAHRLEDSFKVLKAQRNSIIVDESLESLLLAGVDRLRQVLTANRQETDVDEQWLDSVGNPVFADLHERLGDPVADDASTMLGADDGTNVAALLFETEVEGCLNRLEAVLADPQAPCLEEELSIMAQELGGLGEMLQLSAFTQLCESVIQHLETAPERLLETARRALDSWRRSQALVLVGQVNSLPSSIDAGYAAGAPVIQPISSPIGTDVPPERLKAVEQSLEYEGVAAFFDTRAPEESLSSPEVTEKEFTEERAAILETRAEKNSIEVSILRPTPSLEAMEENDREDVVAAEFDIYAPPRAPRQPDVTVRASSGLASSEGAVERAQFVPPSARRGEAQAGQERRDEFREERVAFPSKSASLSREVQASQGEVPLGDIRWREVKQGDSSPSQPKESQENTVRIPVRQLDRLNDLFGELTIERNGLSLHLGRLRNLIESLSRRVGALEQSNIRLRTAYDTESMKSEVRKRNEDPLPTSHFTLYTSFDALEMDRYSDLHLLSMEVMETIVQIQEVTSDIGLAIEDTDVTARELNQTAKQLQTNLTRVRMRPLSELVGRFSRALRDLSLQYGKQVELKVYGKGTLIDRSILEAMSDPLMHLVRNAFDHGIEDPATRTAQGKPAKGVIEIKAAHRGNQTIITISDDGNGINLNKIRARAEAMGLDAGLLAAASEDELLSLIFEPGFSTADRVTDLSGRGVGMDVVRNNLKLIRGDIRVDTQPLRGTTFTLTVPFTLSVARVLLVESNGMLLAFPTDVIEEMLLPSPEQVLKTPLSEVLKWEGEMVPLMRISTLLTFYCPRRVMTPEGVPSISEPTVLMISLGDQLAALLVERCWGEREVAIRQVEGTMTLPPGFASTCVLGDGKVVPLVDAAALLRSSSSSSRHKSVGMWESREEGDRGIGRWGDRENGRTGENMQERATTPRVGKLHLTPYQTSSQKDTILVVDDSINVRRFLALALEKAGYLVEQAKDGQDAVEKLLSGTPCCAVICDIEMPRLDGYGFLARVKSDPKFSELPIAMLTSRSGDKHRQLAMTLGAAAYFSKPYNERELLRTLKQVITENRARKPIPSGVG